MRISKLIFAAFLATLAPVSVFAATGVTSSELQSSSAIILPSAESLDLLDGYSEFQLQESTNISGGLQAIYEARLNEDPWLSEELPRIQILLFSYSTEKAADSAFGSITDEDVTILSSDDRNVFFESKEDENVDAFNTIDADYLSFHHVRVSGNLIMQASLYHEDGEYDGRNVKTYYEATSNSSKIEGILEDALDNLSLSLGLLFPPTNTDFSARSEKSSLNMSELYEIPENGTIDLSLYVGNLEGAVGTIFDSAGISSAAEGDIYMHLNADGRLFAGIYAPEFDADCPSQSGWFRIETSKYVYSYEWNDISLHYGVGGFSIDLNGENVATCSVSQPFSTKSLYFGDFPGDSIEESMIGYMNDFATSYSLTDGGDLWDEILSEQLFFDLPNSDVDLPIFQFLKEEGIFLGSDGYLNPDVYLNRAEMTKVLLKTFNYASPEGVAVEFWDVAEGAWYEKYLAKALEIEMIEGHEDGSFQPTAVINHAEFYTMLHRIDGLIKESKTEEYLDVSDEDWFMAAAAYAFYNDLVSGSYFRPAKLMTRRDAAHALYKLLTSDF